MEKKLQEKKTTEIIKGVRKQRKTLGSLQEDVCGFSYLRPHQTSVLEITCR